jgi:hypothetical protein
VNGILALRRLLPDRLFDQVMSSGVAALVRVATRRAAAQPASDVMG